jgi:hypothetical protein
LVAASPLHAQTHLAHEVSIGGGAIRIAADDSETRSSWWGGASYGRGAGRGHVRFEYQYFPRTFDKEAEQLHLMGAAWFIEWLREPRQGIRPFLQVGGLFGIQESSLHDRNVMLGPSVAGGLTVYFTEGLFVRPDVRWTHLQGPEGPFFPLQAGGAMGWRF